MSAECFCMALHIKMYYKRKCEKGGTMAKQNLTLALPKELIKKAKIIAVKNDTSLSLRI